MHYFVSFLAHAGEEHSDAIESLSHYEWYYAIPVFIAIVAGVGYLVWIISNKNKSTLLTTLAVVFLVCGMTMYELSPPVSIISLVSGMVLAGFLALTGLSK